jgi:hypothetical protein
LKENPSFDFKCVYPDFEQNSQFHPKGDALKLLELYTVKWQVQFLRGESYPVMQAIVPLICY